MAIGVLSSGPVRTTFWPDRGRWAGAVISQRRMCGCHPSGGSQCPSGLKARTGLAGSGTVMRL